MTLSLNVLNHLGINLYSNVAAVLSEIVANSWDADSDKVTITVKDDQVIIEDDGEGMDLPDINERFLYVGYRRREDRPPLTEKGRHVFGRKGIGKLSLFSVADTVDVYTVKNGKRNAFRMNVPDITKSINAGSNIYNPERIPIPSGLASRGTRVVLSDLRRKTAWTVNPLRRRLARRFGILGSAHGFSVKVNRKPIGLDDRGFEKKIQFLWTFGDIDATGRFTNATKVTKYDGLVDPQLQYKVSGWIGAVERSGDLDEGGDEEVRDNNNKITILAWGKLIQEDMLEDFREGGLYTKYLIGEIQADFLDLDDQPDIATSSREKVIQEDPRYALLKGYLLRHLKMIKEVWTEWRKEEATEKALQNAAVAKWYKGLKSDDTKRYARTLFEKIQSMPINDDAQRREIYKHGILAFERLQMHDGLERLANLTTVDALQFATIFTSLEEIESVLYYEMASERLEVIRSFEKLTDEDAKEKAIQVHLYKNLWLLHPSWDRAASGTEHFEKTVAKEFAMVTASLTPAERKARYDIKYKTAAGKHIIVELKKRSRRVSVEELLKQLRKYKSALEKCLSNAGKQGEKIEIVCVLGEQPDISGYNVDPLMSLQARVVTYGQLIEDALQSYDLAVNKDLGELRKIIDQL